MKSFYRIAWVVSLVLLLGCGQQQQTVTETQKETIQKEVKAEFNQLVSAVNQLKAAAWSNYYSKDEFLSAIAGADSYTQRNAWVNVITNYFSMRELMRVEPFDVRVTALTPNLALLTSAEKTRIGLKSGTSVNVMHAFTMLWKKESDGWKILHSHESWVDETRK